MIIPEDYITLKFYELGHYPKRNRYNDTYQCGCPICKEGTSLGKKRRCFYIPSNDNIFCHNCGWSSKPAKWICHVSGMSNLELIEDLKNYTPSDIQTLENVETPKKTYSAETLPKDCINLSDTSQISFYKGDDTLRVCMQVIQSRRLDTAINKPQNLYLSLTDFVHKNRLIIPFYNERSDIEFYQSRTIMSYDTKKPKYLSKIGAEKTLFNINTVDPNNEHVFIFEGPLNAFFTKNSVAVAGITEGKQTFTKRQQDQIDTTLKLHKKIWVLDSQWLDNASLIKTESLLKQGESVFMWPLNFGKKFKDFNDIAIHCKINEIKEDFIIKNTCEGITGILKLAEIKRRLN
jgi:hypothetical protein